MSTIPSSLRELVSIVKEDLVAHGNDPTKPGFLTVASHRFGNWVHQLPRGLARKPLVLAYRLAYVHCRNRYGIELPYSVNLGRRVVIEHQGSIVVHGASVIGDECVIRQGVTIGNRYLDRPTEAPTLCARVNVGAGAKILGDVHLGNDSAVGANAVVLKDVRGGHTVVGIPAHVVADFTPPLVSRTLKLES
jgi:serine O-acetyltransferase